MLAYLGLERAKEEKLEGSTDHFSELDFIDVPEMGVQLVERLVKVRKSPHKCHCNIIDSEMKFFKHISNWMQKKCSEEDSDEYDNVAMEDIDID